MEKIYDPKKIEPKIQELWEKNKIFRFDSKSKKPVFTIDTPPPTISGTLHMGHAMHYTQFEFIARFKRMKGFNVFFPIGWDDNGQPTERFIEKEHNIDLDKVSKSEFIKIVKREIKKVEENYKKDLMTLGHSYDWSLLYRTIEDNCARNSQLSFVDLFKKNLVYRSEEPTIWCVSCRTALSQADVEDKHRTTQLFYIDFELENKEKISIATTRPELLPACVGIFVNPNDTRYRKLIGKKAIVPIFNQKVPIMQDDKVDPEFGTGIVMICTFGDKTDIEWWKIHKLPFKIVITKDGKLNENAGKYKGLKLEQAKKEIVKDLEKIGVLKKKESLEQTVGTCWRCHNPVEFIITKQWFIKIIENKDKLIEQGRKIKWYPEYYRKRYEDWINNLSWDWLISRQRHHGIPIPVWYCKKCDNVIIPDEKDLPIDPETHKPKKKCKCGSDEFVPEKDVFDTWMTSSLTPQIALGWAENDEMFKKYFPENLRPQGHDIIRTWAFYTIVKAFYHFNEIPWKDIMISGHALDPKGKAMHKSLGNVIEPTDIIEKYGTDALRFWAASAKLGEDLPFQEKDVVTGRKLFTKLWNASRFVISNLKDYKNVKPKELKTIDKWILNKLFNIIKESTDAFERYEYSIPKTITENFFWHDFCDNYLEIVKYRLYNPDGTEDAAKYTLYQTLLSILKLFAPIIPHITEEIYQKFFKKEISIHISKWPEIDKNLIDKNAEEIGDMAVAIISVLRQYKSNKGLPLNAELKKVDIECVESIKKQLKNVLDDIKGAMRIKEISFGKGEIPVEGYNIKLRVY